MFDPNTTVPKADPRRLIAHGPQEPKQQRMMVVALALLLVALGIVLYRDRDFWFPDQPAPLEAEDEPRQTAPVVSNPQKQVTASGKTPLSVASNRHSSTQTRNTPPSPATATPPAATISRTVLPPLEVEVVAGDVHRTIHPGSNSVSIDLQSGSKPQGAVGNTAVDQANLTNAAERVQMSAETNEVVTRTVKPGYPLLARQMKVQGSVILQALIGRDGDIQGLHVVSGPPILAGAAQEAVKQWRFKPHYQGAEPIETQAKITVNFTISTN